NFSLHPKVPLFPSVARKLLCADSHLPPAFGLELFVALSRDANRAIAACPGCVLADHRQGLELLRRARWLDRFDGPAPAQGSGAVIALFCWPTEIKPCDRRLPTPGCPSTPGSVKLCPEKL